MRERVEIRERHSVELAKYLVHVVRVVEERPSFRQTIRPAAESTGGLKSVDEREPLRRARALQLGLRERRRAGELDEQRLLE